MKNFKKSLILLIWTALFFCILSCNILKNAVNKIEGGKIDSLTKSAGRNLSIGIGDSAKYITQNLIKGLKGSLDTLNPDIKKIMQTIDSLGNLSNAQLKKIGDSLHIQLSRIKNDVNDEKLKNSLISFLEKMTGKLKKDTKTLLSDIFQNALDSLSRKSSKMKFDIIVKNLMSDSNAMVTQRFLNKALQPTLDSLANKIDKVVNKVHDEVGFVQRNAWWLIGGIGAIAFGIIGYIWFQRRRYANLLKILTVQINAIPAKDTYDNLTKEIQTQAQKDGLETLLRSTLHDQGINN